MTTNKKLLAAALTVAMGTSVAHANFDVDGVYVLGGIGAGFFDDAKYDSSSDSFKSEDKSTFAWRLGAGYMFNDYLGLELNYIHFNEAESSYNDSDSDRVKIKHSAESVPVLAVLKAPVDQFALFAKIGTSYNIVNKDVKVDGTKVYSDEDKKWEFAYGFGGEYNFTDNMAVQVEYLVTGEDTSGVFGNLAYKF